MKYKDIPVYLEGKHIEMTEEVPHVLEKVYRKFRGIFGVKKVYYTKGKRIDMENRPRKPYQVRSI